jgi:hypothetical protein
LAVCGVGHKICLNKREKQTQDSRFIWNGLVIYAKWSSLCYENHWCTLAIFPVDRNFKSKQRVGLRRCA